MKKAPKEKDLATLSGRQCRTVRAWLGMTRDDLARASGASVRAIANLEDGKVATLPGTVALILRALHRDGVRLVGDGLELTIEHSGKTVARKP